MNIGTTGTELRPDSQITRVPRDRSSKVRGARHDAILGGVRLGIAYETVYVYERPVNFAPHHLRVIPRPDPFARLRRLEFQTLPEAKLRYQRDVFDNIIASFSFQDASEKLELRMTAEVEITRKNPFDFILAPEAVELPFRNERQLAPLLRIYSRRRSRGVLALPDWTPPTASARRGTVETLAELTQRIREGIAYERREEGPARSPAETLRRGRGACRDVAVLLAEILRGIGLPARIVSGYLREADESIRRAERSLHAWVEAFLPGAGWIGLDPTTGIFCDHNFIATAVGLRPAHVTPISGSFYHREPVPARMTSRVELTNPAPASEKCHPERSEGPHE